MSHTIDAEGRATVASAQAQGALARGDTREAQQYSSEAARVFEQELAAATDDQSKNLLRFFAATQYYRGGYYAKAQQLAEKIAIAKLPGNTRHLLPQFVKDVKDRASRDYPSRIKKQVTDLWSVDFHKVLAILAEHPFAFEPGILALMRAVCFEATDRFQSAARFYRKSAGYDPNNPDVYIRMKDLPARLAESGDFTKAWEYVRVQLEIFPNPISKMLASLLYHQDARTAKDEAERDQFTQEQMRLFHEAKNEFEAMPDPVKSNAGLKEVIQMGYKIAALTLFKRDKKQDAIEVCKEAIEAAPELPHPWRLLGVIDHDNTDVAVAAFRKAIELGDTTYLPYACLAHYAMIAKNYKEAGEMATAATDHWEGDSMDLLSILYQWRAISVIQLGGDFEYAGALFRRALEIAPENEYAKHNFDHYLKTTKRSEANPQQETWNVPQFSMPAGSQSSNWKGDLTIRSRRQIPTRESVGAVV